ncbi:MAG: hypothetical protein N2Z63_01270 [Thiobacillaceae bacterium]|nr:hypothetical protein [Thiobacillaceae bacterium]
MNYYLWVDAQDRPIPQAWAYQDETERMVEEARPPPGAAALRTGTREALAARSGLREEDFVGDVALGLP